MNRIRKGLICLFIMVVAIGISGCGAENEEVPSEPVDENTVIIENYKYQPAEITIQSGETITWINKDSVRHNAKGDSFDTGLLGKEESAEQQFDEPGTYDYHCTPHPYMKGKVIVE